MKHLILMAIVGLCIFPATYAQEKKTKENDQFSITGNITGLGTGEIILKYEYLGDIVYKTTKLENGMFTFQGKLEKPPTFSRLVTPDKKFDYGLFLENAEMQITGMIKDAGSWVKITGSATDAEYRAEYQAFYNSFAAINDQIKVVRKQILELGKTDTIAAEKKSHEELKPLLNQIKLKKLDFIKSHPKSYVSLFELENKRNNFDGKEISDAFSSLDVSIRESFLAKRLAASILTGLKTGSG